MDSEMKPGNGSLRSMTEQAEGPEKARPVQHRLWADATSACGGHDRVSGHVTALGISVSRLFDTAFSRTVAGIQLKLILAD